MFAPRQPPRSFTRIGPQLPTRLRLFYAKKIKKLNKSQVHLEIKPRSINSALDFQIRAHLGDSRERSSWAFLVGKQSMMTYKTPCPMRVWWLYFRRWTNRETQNHFSGKFLEVWNQQTLFLSCTLEIRVAKLGGIPSKVTEKYQNMECPLPRRFCEKVSLPP